MKTQAIHTVTGAFGFTGRYISHRLLQKGLEVNTLTNSPEKKTPADPEIPVHPLSFDQPERLRDALVQTETLYNTYWIRFEYDEYTFDDAVRNSRTLFTCARKAGVERIIHISITNPSKDSDLPYFRGKAAVEEILRQSGVPYTILRPALLFGRGGILVNNIAWILRRFPLFGVFGGGHYRVQPIHVDDLAALSVKAGKRNSNETIDAIGPETFSFRKFVKIIGKSIGHERPIVSIPLWLGLVVAKILQPFLNDIILTLNEIRGLMRELLYVDSLPVGNKKFSRWTHTHGNLLGTKYESELARR